MQLKLKKSQKTAGMLSKSAVFMLDARAELTQEESDAVRQYKLGSLVVYNSESSRRHLQSVHDGLESGGVGGFSKSFARLAMAKLSLNITIAGLSQGVHIECKDLDELLGAQEAVLEACQMLHSYIETAKSFDGREEVIDIAEMGAA